MRMELAIDGVRHCREGRVGDSVCDGQGPEVPVIVSPVVDQLPDVTIGRILQMFQQADVAQGQATLTLEVKVDSDVVIDLSDSGREASAGGGLNGLAAPKDIPLLPVTTSSVAELNDRAVFVKGVHANLPTSHSDNGRRLSNNEDTLTSSPSFQLTVANGEETAATEVSTSMVSPPPSFCWIVPFSNWYVTRYKSVAGARAETAVPWMSSLGMMRVKIF